MSDAVYWAVCAALLAGGFAAGRWRWAPAAAFAVWAAAVGIAAASGQFRETGEDNTLGLVVFFVAASAVWVGCFLLGVMTRRVARRRRAGLP